MGESMDQRMGESMGKITPEHTTPDGGSVNPGLAESSLEARRPFTARSLLVGAVAGSLLVGLGVATGQVARSSSEFVSSVSLTQSVHQPSTIHVALPAALPAAHEPSPKSSSATATQAEPHDVSAQRTNTFDGRPVRVVRTVRMRVTAYSPDEKSCGKSADGITASGYSVATNGGALVAADPTVLALGSLVAVPGYEREAIVPVLDTGGAIKGNRLDVLFPTHEEARRWGVRDLDVLIYEYDDGKPNGFRKFRRRS